MSDKEKTVIYPEQLMAISARNGLQLAQIEAWIVLKLLDDQGYTLKATEDFELLLHDNSADRTEPDEQHTMFDCIDLCREINEEALQEECSKKNRDEALIESLQKDELIISGLMTRAAKVIPARVRVYNVGVIESLRKVIPIEAASWEEARLKAEELWKNGECTLSAEDFAGVTYTCYN